MPYLTVNGQELKIDQLEESFDYLGQQTRSVNYQLRGIIVVKRVWTVRTAYLNSSEYQSWFTVLTGGAVTISGDATNNASVQCYATISKAEVSQHIYRGIFNVNSRRMSVVFREV